MKFNYNEITAYKVTNYEHYVLIYITHANKVKTNLKLRSSAPVCVRTMSWRRYLAR